MMHLGVASVSRIVYEENNQSENSHRKDVKISLLTMALPSNVGRESLTFSDVRDSNASETEKIGKADMQQASGPSRHDHAKMRNSSKVFRRLAQNREAARKSRLRKKAYVQQLEISRVKLNQLEQELHHLKQQGALPNVSATEDESHPAIAAFNLDYTRWVEQQNRHLSKLRSALETHTSSVDLRALVENGTSLYDELFQLKSSAVKADVFHIVSGMWKTPAERCLMWMGGFRPSDLLKTLIPQVEPLSEQQVMAICNLQQCSQQAEDALSQGMEALQENLSNILCASFPAASDITDHMGHIVLAVGKLGTLENFIWQADNLRQQMLHQLNRILTVHQAARSLLAIGDYFSRLRALSSLWVARPHENKM